MANSTNSEAEIAKYIRQIERKREYNRKYYQTKIKPKKEATNQKTLKSHQDQVQKQTEEKLKWLQEENIRLTKEVDSLTLRVRQLERELLIATKSNEIARQRIKELLKEKILNNAISLMTPSSEKNPDETKKTINLNELSELEFN